MKYLIVTKITIFLMLFYSFTFSQIKVSGFLNSSGYLWENASENQQLDFYQGLNLKLASAKNPDIYLKTYFRAAYRGDPAKWQEKIYNVYLNLNIDKNNYFRIGRQFLYHGVINGTIDGAFFGGKIARTIKVKAIVGLDAPYNRDLDLRKWDEGNVLGAYLSYLLPWNGNIDVSYFQKNRQENLYWQQLGGVLNGYINNQVFYYARLDYNLLKSDVQMMRYRLGYNSQLWYLSAEFNSAKPRIYEDSFFNIFEVEAHNQIRLAATRRIGQIDFGLQFLHTMFEEDNDDKIIGTFGFPVGSIGVLYQNGYGGKNIGYFGEIKYKILSNLTAKLYNSFYNYERALTNISEDALSFSAGLSYQLKNLLILNGEIQEANNEYFSKDWRGLIRLTYLFRN